MWYVGRFHLLADQKRIKRQMQLGIGSNAIFPRRHIGWR